MPGSIGHFVVIHGVTMASLGGGGDIDNRRSDIRHPPPYPTMQDQLNDATQHHVFRARLCATLKQAAPPKGGFVPSSASTYLMAIHIYIDVSRFQGGDRGLKMGSVSGLDHDLERHRLGRQIGEDALVRHLNDIGA